MASHQIHNRRVARTSHASLENRLTEDVAGGASTTTTTSSESTAKPLRDKAIVRHTHALGSLGLKLALELRIGDL